MWIKGRIFYCVCAFPISLWAPFLKTYSFLVFFSSVLTISISILFSKKVWIASLIMGFLLRDFDLGMSSCVTNFCDLFLVIKRTGLCELINFKSLSIFLSYLLSLSEYRCYFILDINPLTIILFIFLIFLKNQIIS